jgi:hypothetical protein
MNSGLPELLSQARLSRTAGLQTDVTLKMITALASATS